MFLNSITSQLFSFFTSSTGRRFHLFRLQRNQSISSSPSVSANLRFPPSSPVPTHQHIAHLILEQKSADQALQTFRWASELLYFQHSQPTYRALIHKLCTFRRFDLVHELLDEMPGSIGFPPDEDVFVTFVRGLGRAQKFREVVKVPSLVCKFGKEPSLKIYNSILDVLMKKDIDIAREFYRKKMMDCSVKGDDYTFGILMKGLCLTNRIGDCFRLLQVMKFHGLIPSTVIYNTLIHALCKNGKVGRARSLMNVLVEPNDVTYNLLISAYCKDENYVQALVLLEKAFSSRFVPDVITMTKVIALLCNVGRVSEAVEVVEMVETNGRKVDVVAYNTLIKGLCRLGKAKVGIRYLKEMELKGCLPNVDTYNALISGFCEIDMLGMALDLSTDMKTAGVNWNFVTYATLIRGLCLRGRVEEAYRILELMEQTKCASRGPISPYNNMLYGLYRENRYIEALDFLKRMGKMFPRAVDRSLRILGLCKEGSMHDPKMVYDQMIKEGGIPSALVYSGLIYRYCRNNSVRQAFDLMNEMVCHGYYPVASTCNALISCFCSQGKVTSALKLVDDMLQSGCLPDIGTYNPLIDVLCKKGDLQKALMIFHQMVEMDIAPNYDTWVSLFVCIRRQESTCLDSNSMSFYVQNQLRWILET